MDFAWRLVPLCLCQAHRHLMPLLRLQRARGLSGRRLNGLSRHNERLTRVSGMVVTRMITPSYGWECSKARTIGIAAKRDKDRDQSAFA